MKRFLCLLLTAALLLPIANAAEVETVLRTIKELNTNSEVGSHADDYYQIASIERSYRETVDLTGDSTGSTRYTNAWYPRVTRRSCIEMTPMQVYLPIPRESTQARPTAISRSIPMQSCWKTERSFAHIMSVRIRGICLLPILACSACHFIFAQQNFIGI